MKHIHSSTWLAMVIAGMALGTAWAIRGQFGHEQGAAWAGGIGCLCIVLLAKKQDWYNKAIKAAFAGAVGWGLGGMMSYGAVVGYGRGVDLVNVYYGLLMLLVIGGLYGFVGGGLFGLALADHQKKKVKWHQVITEMTVGAIIFYYFIIEQLGIYMTPPRSEAWGVSAGMAIALFYYMVRTKQHSALRVAVFAAFGGGFGFAFGNFLQVLGNVAQLNFNMWNVMEYSLGFFGGAGMAYAVFTSDWPVVEKTKFFNSNLMVPLVGLVLMIPFFVWQQSFVMKDLQPTLERLVEGETSTLIRIFQWLAFAAFIIPAILWIRTFYRVRLGFSNKIKKAQVKGLFLGVFGIYLFFTFLITGSILSFYRIEQFLYILNFGLIIWLIPQVKIKETIRPIAPVKWSYALLAVMVFLLLLSIIAINTHGEMPGMNRRFEF
ncbi:hypothetical protein [Pleomorphovibrio marinus]|uniref:hypothetical protein n=1 Tax=Pleomorphovibrio marinus TaxID=2164132 RepID=UPI000E0A07A6|nr:hypothetical protein [Pleomorphovibrio marinus]